MLVLSRYKDESIMIGQDIEIVIVEVRGNKVRLGISAPKHVPVHRREVYEAIRREGALAGRHGKSIPISKRRTRENSGNVNRPNPRALCRGQG